jgi:hypothetical protein
MIIIDDFTFSARKNCIICNIIVFLTDCHYIYKTVIGEACFSDRTKLLNLIGKLETRLCKDFSVNSSDVLHNLVKYLKN